MSLAAFAPTHTVPNGGLEAWAEPEPSLASTAELDPGLQVRVLERNGAWARILCSNGWTAWVDGRSLVPLAPPMAAPPPPPPPMRGAPAPWAPAGQPAASLPPAPPRPGVPQWPAQAASAAAAPAAAGAPAGARAAMGTTVWMTLGGGAAVALSAVLPWISLNLGAFGSVSENAFKVPLEFLWSTQSGASVGQTVNSPLTVGLALLAVGIVGAAAALRPGLDLARRAAGGLAVVIASDFLRQMSSALGQLNQGSPTKLSIFSVLGFGAYLAALGGVLLLIGNSVKNVVPATQGSI